MAQIRSAKRFITCGLTRELPRSGVRLEDLPWDFFKELKGLYEPFSRFTDECDEQRFMEAESFSEEETVADVARSPICKSHNTKDWVIYGTPEPEPCRNYEGITYGDGEIELERVQCRNPSPEL